MDFARIFPVWSRPMVGIAAAIADRDIRIDQLILESGRSLVYVGFDPRLRMM
jgi:hypothetical protein